MIVLYIFSSQMGDASIEVTDENRDASQLAKGKAIEAISESVSYSFHVLGSQIVFHCFCNRS